MVSVTAAASVNLSGVRNGETTSVAIMLMPDGSRSMSGCAMIAYTWFEPGTIMSTINTAPTAPSAYAMRLRSSMRCETNPPSGLGFSAGSDMALACGSLFDLGPGGLLAPGLQCALPRRWSGYRSLRQSLYQIIRCRFGWTNLNNTGKRAAGGILENLFGLGDLLMHLAQLGKLLAAQLAAHVALHVLDKAADARNPAAGGARHLRQALWAKDNEGNQTDDDQLGEAITNTGGAPRLHRCA